METKRYLGDGLYAEFDGYQFRLWTDRGSMGGIHEVFLEPDVVHALLQFVEAMTEPEGSETL